MDTNEFIHNFYLQFDDTEESIFTMQTKFTELDEWTSLNALAILNMIEKKYAITLKAEEMRMTKTIQELYDLVQKKAIR